MSGQSIDMDRLRKILRLMDSKTSGESIAAFQMAKGMLERAGLSFWDMMDSSATDGPDMDGANINWDTVMLRRRVAFLEQTLETKSTSLAQHERALEQLVEQLWAMKPTDEQIADFAQPQSIKKSLGAKVQEIFCTN